MKQIISGTLITIALAHPGIGQDATSPRAVVVCDERITCSHRYDNGELLRTVTGPNGVSVTAALEQSKNGKYFRLRLGVSNGSQKTFDLIPEAFRLDVVGQKPKVMKPIPPEDIEKAAERASFWGNFLTAMTAHMARDTVKTTSRTEIQSSGSVSLNGLDGPRVTGNYAGTDASKTTSTTSIPDYTARAEAAQAIRDRNQLVAAKNAQVAESALRDNTLEPGQAVGGFVYFKSATADELRVHITVDDTEYDFEF